MKGSGVRVPASALRKLRLVYRTKDGRAAGTALARLDFAGNTIRVRRSYYLGQLTTPKPGKMRAVPLAADVASALAQLGGREYWVGEHDLVFCGDTGGYLDGSALRRRNKAAVQAAGLCRCGSTICGIRSGRG